MSLQSLAESAMQHLSYFDNMVSLVPVEGVKSEHTYLNPKFLFKRRGFDTSVSKATAMKRRREEEVKVAEDKEDDDEEEEEEEEETYKLIIPATFVKDVEDLRSRLKSKALEARAAVGLGDKKRNILKQKRDAAQEKKKKKIQNQKARANTKPEASTEEPAAKKQKIEESESGESNVIVVDPSKIKADFMFGSVAASLEDKTTARGDELSGKKKTGGKTIQQKLKAITDFKEKVETARQAGNDEKAERMLHKSVVNTALSRAVGEKVEDNEKSLKRAIKRDQKKKEKSAEKWKNRTQIVQSTQKKSLDKRNDNLKKRADDKRNFRLGIKSKKPAAGKGGKK